MSCPHNQHCHECEKIKNFNTFTEIGLVIITILAFWLFGWRAWKFVIWPWLFLTILYVAKFFIDKKEKKKKAQKKADKNQQKEKKPKI